MEVGSITITSDWNPILPVLKSTDPRGDASGLFSGYKGTGANERLLSVKHPESVSAAGKPRLAED